MSSTKQDSSAIGGRVFKPSNGDKATRRTWSPREKACLLASMKDIVAHGWKADNGFRGGCLTRLEELLAIDFPGKGIKATPHINSKLQSWKMNYYSLNGMLSQSGVGWNGNMNYTIDCTDEQWEQISKCDSNARNMRHRSWPMFEDWQIIFGKDRATGENAEDAMDAVNNMMEEEVRSESGKHFEENDAFMDDVYVNDGAEISSSKRGQDKEVSKCPVKRKKRKSSDDSLQTVVEIFGDISRRTNARLEMVASRIGYDFDVDQAKKDAFTMLGSIPGLTLDDKFDVCEIFTDQTNRLLTFQGLPEDSREKYVQRLLKSKK